MSCALFEDLLELAKEASDADLAAEVVAKAEALHLGGRAARAVGLLEAAISLVQEPSAVRHMLEAYVSVALALGQRDAMRAALHRCERAEAADLARLLKGALLSRAGDRVRAIELLSEPLTGAPELARLANLVSACCAAAPERLDSVLAEAAAVCRGDPVAEGRWHIWRGNAAYARGDYAEAVVANQRAVESLAAAPAWRIAALTNGGYAALEVPDFETAGVLAAEAELLGRVLRHGYGEANAAALGRIVAFRRGAAAAPDSHLLDAVAAISDHLGTEVAVMEAAVARGAGQLDLARALVWRGMAALGEREGGLRTVVEALAADLGMLQPPEDARVDELAGALRLQVEALLAPHRTPPLASDVARWVEDWPDMAPDRPLDVLSLEECRDRLGL